MPLFKQISKVTFGALIGCLALVSCDMDSPQREVCDYTLLLRYDYNEENSTTENRIEQYVHTIDEYLFDGDNILYAVRRITPDVCRTAMDSEWNLPLGRYSVIAIGNRDERSRCFDQRSNAEPVPGVTHREDMRLSLDNAAVMTGDTRGPSEPLYQGYRTFTVTEEINRIRVDMINVHLQLRFRVTWLNGAAPERGDYYATLDNVPSDYRLMPEYISPRGVFTVEPFSAAVHEEYREQDNDDAIQHIPHVTYMENNVVHHRYDTYLNADNEVYGEFRSYRIKSTTAPMLWLYRASDTRAEEDEMVLPRGIDLQAYFEWYDYKLDHELKQDYELDIVVDGDKINITPLQLDDWDEGGELGGNR